jgi:hypothetical protein
MQAFDRGLEGLGILLVPFRRQGDHLSIKANQRPKPALLRNEGEAIEQVEEDNNRGNRRYQSNYKGICALK